jgi:hypothetical protein
MVKLTGTIEAVNGSLEVEIGITTSAGAVIKDDSGGAKQSISYELTRDGTIGES